MSEQIVMRLGGEVGFSEAPGGGTIFYVERAIAFRSPPT
jgi:hypothetical protein